MGGTCCGYVNNKQDRDKTVYTGSSAGNREREIQDVLDKLNDENQNDSKLHPQDKIEDQIETSSQRSFLYGSLIQNNIHSMIQNHGTMEQDDNERFKKEPFYGAEALAEYVAAQTVDINLQNIAKEEVAPLISDQIGLEIQEQKKLALSTSKEVKDLEKKKSELIISKQETSQALNQKDKEVIRRTSQQYDQQSTLIKLQQQQLIQQQQLLEKQQQIIQQQMQQQMLVQQQQIQLAQSQKQQQPQQPTAATPQQNATNQPVSTQPNTSPDKTQQNGSRAPVNLPPLKKPTTQNASQSAPQSPQLSARGRKAENDVNSSFNDTQGSAKSLDKPQSILKRRLNNDLNSSFNSDADSQRSKSKKKVKFKESAFKKTSKKKKY